LAEEWNEYHHLLIHESLGGDRMWRDRFLAQHSALLYYVVLLGLWLVSPALVGGEGNYRPSVRGYYTREKEKGVLM